jgi:hypothetical protein
VPSAQGLDPPAVPPAKRPSRWLDRIIGVVLGLALGVGVIVVFVFEGSEETIDAARISGTEGGGSSPGQQQVPARVPLVRVIDGKPPPSGPVQLDFRQGQTARFVVGSDQAVQIEIRGYGVTRTVDSGRTLVAFRAKKRGQFPLVVSASKIDIASLRVVPR